MQNTNPATGIHYGYIRAAYIDNDVWDDLTIRHGTDPHYAEALRDFKAENRGMRVCGRLLDDDELEQQFNDQYQPDEPVYEGEYQGVKYRTSWMGGAPHLFVFESPVKWNCLPCSLCVPNAGNLDQAGQGEYEAYGVPVEWLDETFLRDWAQEQNDSISNKYEDAPTHVLEEAFSRIVYVKEEEDA